MARHEEYNIRQVSWQVDDDNPGWSAVRVDAIQAALQKGRDYAAALGSSRLGVEEVADTGLLGGSGDGPRIARARSAAFAGGGQSGDVDTPSPDPVPQELTAVIEARLRATPAALAT